MPRLRDVEVFVMDDDDGAVPEYGVVSDSNTVTCYVESKHAMPIRIGIKPIMPFMAFTVRPRSKVREWFARLSIAHYTCTVEQIRAFVAERVEEHLKKAVDAMIVEGHRPTFCQAVGLLEVSHLIVRDDHKWAVEWVSETIIGLLEANEAPGSKDTHEYTGPQPVWEDDMTAVEQFAVDDEGRAEFLDAHVPWHLLATLRLDGRKGVETRTIINLDPREERYQQYDGTFTIENRWVESWRGQLHRCGWRFHDVKSDPWHWQSSVAFTPDPDALQAAMDALLADAEEGVKQAAQIEVTLERITLDDVTADVEWQTPPGESGSFGFSGQYGKLADRPGTIDEIKHTAVLDEGQWTRRRLGDVVHWTRLERSGEPPYAVFKLYYRGEDVLRRHGFEVRPNNVSTGD